MTDMSLYQQLAADLGFAESKMIPKLFAYIADEDEAKFLLAASPPATIEDIAEKTGFPIDKAKCMGCGICVPTCPGDAMVYEEIRDKEFIPE